MEASTLSWARDVFNQISSNIQTVIRGQKDSIRHILAGFISGGHILLDDNPGTGKTTLAKALAKSIDADFKRIQFTPDLMPSDILGVSVFDPSRKTFKLYKGPIFTHILLADEINRASPRTQSALLEAMAEGQVSIDGNVLNLDDLFFVIATSNPVESRGTYPLPEAQMDRFSMQLELGYVLRDEEIAILDTQKDCHPIKNIKPCVGLEEILKLRSAISQVHVSRLLQGYMVDLVSATRTHPQVLLGASPRASIALMRVACALALADGHDFIIPEHIQEIVVPVMAHRLILDPKARFTGGTARSVVQDILKTIPVPV